MSVMLAGGCFAIVPQQLNPCNFSKNKHTFWWLGESFGAHKLVEEIKVLGGTKSCLMMFG